MIDYNDNINLNAPKNLDNKKGVWENGAWRAYNSKAEVLAIINIAYRYLTLTVPIKIAGATSLYWFKDAFASESDLVALSAGSSTTVPEIITSSSNGPIVLDWQAGIIPSGGGITWVQRFGNFRPNFLAEDANGEPYDARVSTARTGSIINTITLTDLFAGLITVQ